MWTKAARKKSGEAVQQLFREGKLKPRKWTDEQRQKLSASRKAAYVDGKLHGSNRKIREIPTIHVPDDFGYWLSGLVDGEGCFAVNTVRGRLQTIFSLTLRSDDVDILNVIHRKLGKIGTVRPSHPRAHTFRVGSAAHCMALVTLFNRYPLRAKKALDFERWAPLVKICYENEKPMRENFKEQVDALTEGRRFLETA